MGVRIDLATRLTRFDHRHSNSILHAIERLEELAFGEDGSVVFWNQTIDFDHRRRTDCLSDRVVSAITEHTALLH